MGERITKKEYDERFIEFMNTFDRYSNAEFEDLTKRFASDIASCYEEERNLQIDNIYVAIKELCINFARLRRIENKILSDIKKNTKIADGKIDTDIEDFYNIVYDFLYEDYKSDMLFLVSQCSDDYKEIRKQTNVKSKN